MGKAIRFVVAFAALWGGMSIVAYFMSHGMAGQRECVTDGFFFTIVLLLGMWFGTKEPEHG